MEASTLATGGIANKMGSALPSTIMDPDMRENGCKEGGMVKDVLGMPTVKLSKAFLIKTNSSVKKHNEMYKNQLQKE